jgi:hypothetical protein
MEQMIGKHAKHWNGHTKARNDINLHFGWLYYINGIAASVWLGQAIYLQYKETAFSPHCVADGLTNEMAVDLCMGSWVYYISGYNEDRGIAERTKIPHFAFLKVAAPLTMLMACCFLLVSKYWLIAEEGRINFYATEYKDKLLQSVDEDAAEKKNIQNIRFQYYNHS